MSWNDLPGQAGRPHAPWIFRCTLDGAPRSVVLALADGCWIAYDARSCRFDGAWSGGVRFDGSVYTGAHGPNPTREGTPLVPASGAATSTFAIGDAGGPPAPIAAQWKGYRIVDGRAVLSFECALDGGGAMAVTESPEVRTADNRLVLERRFTTANVPQGRTPAVRVPVLAADGRTLAIRVDGRPLVVEPGATEAMVPLAVNGTTLIEIDLQTPAAGAKGGAR